MILNGSLPNSCEAATASERVACVVVTYNPDMDLLRASLDALRDEPCSVTVVDNGSANIAELRHEIDRHDVTLVALGANEGIASAQNHGIRLQADADFVFLLDQDTVTPPGIIAALLDDAHHLHMEGLRLAAIGLPYRDYYTGRPAAAFRTMDGQIRRLDLSGDTGRFSETDFVIASGSFIPMATLKDVGMMEEDLFIDLVDLEWCLRATSAGYRCVLSLSHAISHRIGDRRARLFGRSITMHAPIRNYYFTRNCLLLAQRSYIPMCWKRYFLSRASFSLVAFVLVGDARLTRLRFMLRALHDGMKRWGGPYGKTVKIRHEKALP